MKRLLLLIILLLPLVYAECPYDPDCPDFDYSDLSVIDQSNIDKLDMGHADFSPENLKMTPAEIKSSVSESQADAYVNRHSPITFPANAADAEKIKAVLSKSSSYQKVDLDSFFAPKGAEDADVPVEFGKDSIKVGDAILTLGDGDVSMNDRGQLQVGDAVLTMGQASLVDGKLNVGPNSEIVVGASLDIAGASIHTMSSSITYDPDSDTPGTNEVVYDADSGEVVVSHDDDTNLAIGVSESSTVASVNGITLDKGSMISKGYGDFDVNSGSTIDIKGSKISTENDLELRSPQSITQQILEALQSGDSSQFTKSVLVYGPDHINIFPKDNNIEIERSISTQHEIINNYPSKLFVSDIKDDSTVKFIQNFNRDGDGDDSGVNEISTVTFSDSILSPSYKNRAWLIGLEVEDEYVNEFGELHSRSFDGFTYSHCSDCEELGICVDNVQIVETGPNAGIYHNNLAEIEFVPSPPATSIFSISKYRNVDDPDKIIYKVDLPEEERAFKDDNYRKYLVEDGPGMPLITRIFTQEQYENFDELHIALTSYGDAFGKLVTEDSSYAGIESGNRIIKSKGSTRKDLFKALDDMESTEFIGWDKISNADYEDKIDIATDALKAKLDNEKESYTPLQTSESVPAPESASDYEAFDEKGDYEIYTDPEGDYIIVENEFLKKEPVRKGDMVTIPHAKNQKAGYDTTKGYDAFNRVWEFDGTEYRYVKDYD